MEKNLKPGEASRIDKVLSLVRKGIVASKTSLYEVNAHVNDTFIDFYFYSRNKDGTLNTSYSFSETIQFNNEFGFDESFLVLNHKLNHLLAKGYLPI